MRHNTDPSFVGVEGLKQAHGDQITAFEAWAAAEDWERFHSSHYDWWVFPVDRHSSYGLQWVVYDGEVAELKKDDVFLARYVRGVQLVAASWGWDVLTGVPLPEPHPGQAWHDWPVRLHKAGQSVQLFGFDELFASLRLYAHELLRQGWGMTYGGRDLSWLFTTGIDPYRR